ncbi:S1 domain-containing RNA-binding protein [Schleiferilactobacillus shenzhenensis]|uniref:YabR n=1 Tax=Schleiferilactobacillus shenzhenensis LY-73 TaxID=1231336 RepID=U4TGL7_9LACO|nr:S1 domain-containing RNA-binding protein [Schleiferilactobacillus shenzhenensis]ERL63916.1 YabR [Schleiferilactobacillus shenzhenensis LY-73]
MAIEVGAKVQGKVTGITNFGAFVDIGEHKTGLVHISQVSDKFIKDIHDVLSVGDEVTVKVIGEHDGKISLSMRQAEDHPHTEHRSEGRPNNHEHSFHGNNNREGGASHGAPRNSGGNRGGGRSFNRGNDRRSGRREERPDDFDGMLSSFLKESDDRLTSLKRNTEGKRGGRGGRRS